MTEAGGRIGAALLAAALLALQPAVAQPAAEADEAQQPIVVTGIRVQDYRDRLAACLARNCPTDEDADATLALAEALFLEGEYAEARRAVAASLGRNRHRAGDFPEPVSDLFRAHHRLSRHLGFDPAALRSAHGILEALQAGIPVEDHRHFTARFEISEAQMLAGRLHSALRTLERLADSARASGREDVAILAELRAIWFQYVAEPNTSARARLAAMAESNDPVQRIRTIGARVLLSRIHRLEGDERRADALLASLGQGSAERRRLLHSPAYQLRVQEARWPDDTDIYLVLGQRNGMNPMMTASANRMSEDFERAWIDVGFWVLPDGRVSGLEVLRRGAEASWAEPLLESIRGRIYSSAAEATYRLERYTYMTGYEDSTTSTGTRLARRTPRARVEYFDLTVNPPARQPPRGSPDEVP